MATIRINSGDDGDRKDSLSPIVNPDQVVMPKKSLGSKFADAFISDSAKDVKDYILFDVIVPGIKDTIINCMEMIFFGGTYGRSRVSRASRYNDGISNYRAFYQSEYESSNRRGTRRLRDRRDDFTSERIDYRNIIIKDRADAEDIVAAMVDRISNYGEATKADLFDLISAPTTYQDRNWGWVSSRGFDVRRIQSGYLIVVPDAIYLEE